MKTIILFILAFLAFNSSFAKIWRVNNTTGITADFTTAQSANDDVNVLSGDTIHLEPSTISYGALTATKRLVWLSVGAFLGAHPGQQYFSYGGKVDGLSVYAGSANSVFSINCTFINLSAANVGIIRCYVSGDITFNTYSGTGPSNDIVLNCYCTGSLNMYTGSNHNISNNIFEGYFFNASGSGAFLINNVFNAVSGNSANTIINCTLQNNIFNKATNPIPFTNCVVEYNMSGIAGVLPTGNNNQNGVTMSTVFINDNGNSDGDFVLKSSPPTNPAAGAGVGGVDLGAYGGATPFKIALQPAIPAIYKIIAPASPTGNTMNVTFSTKSNN